MHSHKAFATLSEFLLQAGTEYFILDVSRTRHLLDNQRFFDYENNERPYDCPRQGYAWFCLVFWNKSMNQEHYIWFLKLPVDEQGLIQQAARDQFLQIVIEALGNELQKVDTTSAELPENPFVFVPSQQLLADCNAFIRHHLDLPNRPGLAKAFTYIKAPNVQPWAELSVQDISDFASKIHHKPHEQAVIANLSQLPDAVCLCLFSSFEGIKLPSELNHALLNYQQSADDKLSAMALRALASSHNSAVKDYVHSLISSDNPLDIETLVVIAGRFWQCLIPQEHTEQDYLSLYLAKVAKADAHFDLFKGIYADLVHLPSLRVFLLATIRQKAQCEVLNQAIATLFAKRARN
ncbi:DUF3549 family protein [Glaciecola siphonariae]|uniref:DUF3549 family protein n=1 Tax=Glaciecola siphonariae TaxID=521012 RepID=A0ABV9LW25_9ALTE